jgi:hypothetical protein
MWVKVAEGLSNTRERMQQIAAKGPASTLHFALQRMRQFVKSKPSRYRMQSC